ncbi:hypothetical protein MPSEU_001104600 [Mayamaea pseudoterrestris]|nr:hypothetical protein MPSEU_001104600 [Mayamaea pseudoterrestris]
MAVHGRCHLRPALFTMTNMTFLTCSLLLILPCCTAMSVFDAPRFLPLRLSSVSLPGPYGVGVADLFLPIHDNDSDTKSSSSNLENNFVLDTSDLPNRVSIRLLYPTTDVPHGNKMPYLHPLLAKEYLRESMRISAPNKWLKRCRWILYYLKLIKTPLQEQAKLLRHDNDNTAASQSSQLLPIVFFSHGLSVSSATYTYQTASLASQGFLVVVLNHADGSAPAMLKDGISSEDRNGNKNTHDKPQLLLYDQEIAKLLQTDFGAFIQRRREQASYRTREFLAAVHAFMQLNETESANDNDTCEANEGDSTLTNMRRMLRHRLDAERVTFMGHSFGGATALMAASLQPHLAQRVVGHDAGVELMTDDLSQALLAGRQSDNNSGSGSSNDKPKTRQSIHDLDILLLYSKEWQDKNYGQSQKLLELYQQNKLGRTNGTSHVAVVADSHHMEFSDVAMLTPKWLCQATGRFVGKRNAVEAAMEIDRTTTTWLQQQQ